MTNIEKVNTYLSDAGIFYLTTVDGNKPKCRPIGIHVIEKGKLCFGVGTFKDVYQQMVANHNVEICASKDNGFLRLHREGIKRSIRKIDMSKLQKAVEERHDAR